MPRPVRSHSTVDEDLSVDYLSITNNVWHVDVSVHTALYELHVVLC